MPEAACPRHVPDCGTAAAAAGRPALFLDRDGVINHDAGYTHLREAFEFVPGIFELGRRAVAAGKVVVVVTNQAGIARGYYDEAALAALSHWMVARFADEGVPILRVYFCPHHPEATLPGYRLACACRKPAPGMLLAAARDFGLDLGRSLFVGDKPGDMQAGAAAGVGTLVLLGDDPLPASLAGVHRVASLADAGQWLA